MQTDEVAHPWASALYDAVFLYALAATRVIGDGGDASDGKALVAAMKNISFDGMRQVKLHANGDVAYIVMAYLVLLVMAYAGQARRERRYARDVLGDELRASGRRDAVGRGVQVLRGWAREQQRLSHLAGAPTFFFHRTSRSMPTANAEGFLPILRSATTRLVEDAVPTATRPRRIRPSPSALAVGTLRTKKRDPKKGIGSAGRLS